MTTGSSECVPSGCTARRLSATGMEVSRIGLGSYALSGVYGPKDEGEFITLVRRAHELGVTLFDTADAYGPAEEVLGRAIAPFREQVVVSDKVGTPAGGGLTARYVVEACERSLRRLGTDYIDIYHSHYDDPSVPPDEVIMGFEDLLRAGKIRAYGLGHLAPDRLAAFVQCGSPATVLVEFHPAHARAYHRARSLTEGQPIDLIAYSVTGRGLFAGAVPGQTRGDTPSSLASVDPLFRYENLRFGREMAGRVARLGEKYGYTPVQAAIAWVLHQPGVAAALVGPTQLVHLEEDVQACRLAFDEADLHEINAYLAEQHRALDQANRRRAATTLSRPLPGEAREGASELLYALEVLGQQDLLEHASAMSLARDLSSAACGKMEPARAGTRLAEIQQHMGEKAAERGLADLRP